MQHSKGQTARGSLRNVPSIEAFKAKFDFIIFYMFLYL